jgi:hypothetical protein
MIGKPILCDKHRWVVVLLRYPHEQLPKPPWNHLQSRSGSINVLNGKEVRKQGKMSPVRNYETMKESLAFPLPRIELRLPSP